MKYYRSVNHNKIQHSLMFVTFIKEKHTGFLKSEILMENLKNLNMPASISKAHFKNMQF